MSRDYAYTYKPEKGDAICAQLACGVTVVKACEAEGILTCEYYGWRRSFPKFAAQAEDAMVQSSHAHLDRALQIAEECPAQRDEVQLAQLKVQTLFRLAALANPRRYGQKVEHSGEMTHNYVAQPIPVEQRNSDRTVAGANGSAANGHTAR